MDAKKLRKALRARGVKPTKSQTPRRQAGAGERRAAADALARRVLAHHGITGRGR
jgi:hypothetical protein